MTSKTILVYAVVAASAAIATNAEASTALKQIFRASQTMESGVSACATRFEGKAFINCVANELSKYSGRLGEAGPRGLAPQGAPNASQAAAGVRAAPNSPAAASVLNRVASVVGGLAVSSEKETRRAYNRINQAFARAATIMGGKS